MNNYKVINKDEYQQNKSTYLKMIKQLFKNDDSKIANTKELVNHLDTIFDKNIDNDAFLILNIENDKIISIVNFLQYNNIENLWCLFSIFTLKNYRKKGYGKKILKYGIEQVKKKNAKILISGIEKDNKVSIKLHQKVGFIYSGKSWDELAPGFPKNHLGFIIKF